MNDVSITNTNMAAARKIPIRGLPPPPAFPADSITA